jgi:hypothetical protein
MKKYLVNCLKMVEDWLVRDRIRGQCPPYEMNL